MPPGSERAWPDGARPGPVRDGGPAVQRQPVVRIWHGAPASGAKAAAGAARPFC